MSTLWTPTATSLPLPRPLLLRLPPPPRPWGLARPRPDRRLATAWSTARRPTPPTPSTTPAAPTTSSEAAGPRCRTRRCPNTAARASRRYAPSTYHLATPFSRPRLARDALNIGSRRDTLCWSDQKFMRIILIVTIIIVPIYIAKFMCCLTVCLRGVSLLLSLFDIWSCIISNIW